MKKLLILLSLTLPLLANTFAGDITDKKNLCNVIGGITINTMNYSNNTDDHRGAKVGGLAGIGFEHRFKNVAAIEIDALYVNKGAQSTTDNFLAKTTNRLNFHSVELPILFKLYLGKRKIFNINVGGFASYSFYTQLTINGKNKLSGDKINEKSENITKNSNNPKDANGNYLFRPYDAGVVGGFEFISTRGFGAGLRVAQGFVDFINPKFIGANLIYQANKDKKVWHTGVGLYFTYRF